MPKPVSAVTDMLSAWAHRVGGEQYRRARYCDRAALRDRFAEHAAPAADPVDRMLSHLQSAGRRRECLVLCADVLLSGLPEEARMQWLRSMGVEISRKTYYVDLSAATLFVLGCVLSRPAANDDDADAPESHPPAAAGPTTAPETP